MKNIVKNFRGIVCYLLMAVVMSSSLVSCYDDTKIWKEINKINKSLEALQKQLDTELAALSDLVNGNKTIKSVKKQEDGGTLIELSDGTKFTVYPKTDRIPANVVGTTMLDGILYWAMYDYIGQPQPIRIDGQMIPVSAGIPQTRINDESGAIEVSFDGGNTWMITGYDKSNVASMIVGVNIVYSDWQEDAEGNKLALYCELTMADGSTVKVGMQNGRIVLPYDHIFVAYGDTLPFVIDVQDVADYILLEPDGWSCEALYDAKREQIELEITAPTYEEVVANPTYGSNSIAKLMVVFNNGSSAIASIKLSTNPVTLHFTNQGVHIEAGYGISYMLCGITSASNFDAAKYVDICTNHLAGTAQQGVTDVAFMETTSAYYTYKDLRGSAITKAGEYVFWYIVPRTNEDGDLYVVAEELYPVTYKHFIVEFRATKTSFFDATVKFNMEGSSGYTLGYSLTSEFDAEALAAYYTDNYDYLDATGRDIEYMGSFNTLLALGADALEYNTEYTLWFIPAQESKVIFVDDIISWNFKTANFTEGGSIEVVSSNEEAGYDYVSAELDTNVPHMAMFYAAMPTYKATGYPDDASIVSMLLSRGEFVKSTDKIDAYMDGLDADTEIVFFALGVDADGKYGKPLKKSLKTKAYTYNSLKPTITLEDYKVDSTIFKVECEGAVSYAYILCDTSHSDWTELYGGTTTKAAQYIIRNPEGDGVCHTTLDETGRITLSGLAADTEYAFVLVAYSEDGQISKPVSEYFEPIANIGTMVKVTDANWAEGKPTIILGDTENIEFFSFAWYTTPQKGYVAYSMVEHPDNFVNDYYNSNVNTPEKLIAYIIAGCDNGTKDCGHKCEYSEDGYSHVWKEMEDLNGDGRIELDEWVEHREDGLPGVYNYYFYGTKDEHRIYVTWVGEDGNFHEPFVYNPSTDEEESLNEENFYVAIE